MELLEVLEFDKVRNILKKYAATKVGRELIARLNPVSELSAVKRSLSEVTAARELYKEFGSPPFGGIRDLRQILKKVEKGIVLSTKELISVQNTLGGVHSLSSYFRKVTTNLDPYLIEERLHLITSEGLKLVTIPGLERELDRCLDEYGEIRSRASRKLAGLRSEMDNLGNKIRDKLDTIVRSSRFQTMLQDSLVTRRGDRYVVPVKHEYRNVFEGIVHDQSASGLTLFMEPLAVVRLNNRLRELQKEEEEEIYRILQKLTGLIAEKLEIFKLDLEIVTFLDLAFARAGYSLEIGGIAPDINEVGRVRIVKGRHPLLKEDAVPIDISVGDDFRTLIITGPNTGGKTVALKTLGLFVLMAEAGLHIPADRGTEISIFKKVFADIGDEQSIEQNLSTFSSHINRITTFLEQADKWSLVLMDELGAGTDPREGAALGIAILEELRSRQTVAVATTHYSQLKSYAFNQQGVENASVEFDLNTLQPTYHLMMGVPGGSNAFAIALRLGIPEEIIADARELISGEEIEVENIISGLNADRKKYRLLTGEIQEKEREISRLKEEYRTKLTHFEEQRERILQEARDKAQQLVRETKTKTRNLLQELKSTDFNSRPDIDRWATTAHEEFQDIEKSLEDENDQAESAVAVELKAGDQVRLRSGGTTGEILEIAEDRDEVTVRAGVITLKVSQDELVKVEVPEEKERLVQRYRIKKTNNISPRLDLRGERFENARFKLDKYLDDVFLAGLKQVEIIHGKGTGALRDAVKSVLEGNPHVDSFRLGRDEEGGSGVTIASIH